MARDLSQRNGVAYVALLQAYLRTAIANTDEHHNEWQQLHEEVAADLPMSTLPMGGDAIYRHEMALSSEYHDSLVDRIVAAILDDSSGEALAAVMVQLLASKVSIPLLKALAANVGELHSFHRGGVPPTPSAERRLWARHHGSIDPLASPDEQAIRFHQYFDGIAYESYAVVVRSTALYANSLSDLLSTRHRSTLKVKTCLCAPVESLTTA